MTYQETFDYLMQIRKLESRIRRKELRCEELRTCLDAKAIRYDKPNVQTSPTDKVFEILATVADLERDIRKLKDRKAELVTEISDAIDQLENDNEALVLTAYFIRRLPMKRVADDVAHYSVQHTYSIRKKGLKHLGELFEKDLIVSE